ncbi:hypothetical protein ACO2RV_17180 [Ancylobacter sp. VNQ12]|uniref:hypothetical protein n=1 Tax=Ancylobacter sp. VNQ12 TaxID=3400920 RepID=UPI003C121F02
MTDATPIRPTVIEVVKQGPAGPAIGDWRGAWVAGTYRRRSLVEKDGSTWLALRDTSGVPGVSADWDLVVSPPDATEAAVDARDAALIAKAGAEAARGGAEAAQAGAEDARGGAEDARDAALEARDDAFQAIVNPGVYYDTLSELEADLAHPDGTMGVVDDDGVASGIYRKAGALGSGSWVKKSDDTIQGSADRVAAIRSDLASTSDSEKGAALLAYNPRLPYPEESAGKRLSDHGLSVYNFGYRDGDDIAVAINLAINEGRDRGVTYPIILPSSGLHTIGSTIIPRSYYPIRGMGAGLTKLVVETDTPYAQTPGTALAHAGLTGATISAASGHSDAVVLGLTSAVWNDFSKLRFDGFSAGKILQVRGALITDGDETVSPMTTHNTVWNTFRDWMVIGCTKGLDLFGKYGSTPTGGGPANSANIPECVLSKNVYDNLTFWGVSETAIDIFGACDHEVWGHISIHLAADNAVGVSIGSDPVHTGNNYANNHEFPELVFSKSGAQTGLKGVVVPGWSFGNAADIKSDIGSGFTPYQVTPASQSHQFTIRTVSPVMYGLTRVITESRDYFAGGADGGTLMRLSANLSITTSGTEQIVDWSFQDSDTFDMWVVGAPSRITIPSNWPAGTLVEITAGAVWAANATGVRQIRVLKNGATLAGQPSSLESSAGAVYQHKQVITTTIAVSPSDYLTVGVLQTSGGALDLVADGSTFFHVRRL